MRAARCCPLLSATATELPGKSEDAAYLAAFARFLHRNVASGDAADDTRAYGVHVATWLAWCRGTELDLARATVDDVEDYREALIGAGCQPATVAIKLTLVRRFYDAACALACAATTRPPGCARRRRNAPRRTSGS